MSKTLRPRKNGSRVYEIRVSRGRDPLTGKQLTPYSMTWQVPDNYSAKRAEREAAKIEGEFIAKCKAGLILTKKEEAQHRKEAAEQAEKERLEQESKPTFEQYKELSLQRLENEGYATGTINTYNTALKRASNVFGGLKMYDISSNMIRQYVMDMQGTRQYKYSTVTRHFATLKLLFNMAVDDKVIETSPMDDLKPPRKPKSEKAAKSGETKAYSEEEVRRILESAENEPLKWRTLIYFMLDTGCRRGEVAGSKWEHIDLTTGEVTVCNNLQYSPDKGVFDTTPKNGITRKIFLNEEALHKMREWFQAQRLHYFKKGIPQPEYCFDNNRGGAMCPLYITNYFRRFGKQYNIPDFHPHKLRHTMATISIANGADIVSVSKKLGHSNVSITLNVYSHANEEAQRRANDVLAGAIYNEKGQKEA
ncbi:MAG: tyrosine-type recombinase/integrase [Clostridiales bacterium]|nr:tyrosine-type recombinase/integrase [Clostridiales bacterium]